MAAEIAGALLDCLAFWRCPGAGSGRGEEYVDVGGASEVADDGSYRVGVEMKPPDDFSGGCAFAKVGAADFVVALGR